MSDQEKVTFEAKYLCVWENKKGKKLAKLKVDGDDNWYPCSDKVYTFIKNSTPFEENEIVEVNGSKNEDGKIYVTRIGKTKQSGNTTSRPKNKKNKTPNKKNYDNNNNDVTRTSIEKQVVVKATAETMKGTDGVDINTCSKIVEDILKIYDEYLNG